MASATTTHVIRGKLHWAKLLGQPRLNKFTNEREWTVDVTPDDKGRSEINKLGIADKLKTPKSTDPRKETFLTFKQREFREDRVTKERIKNDPVKITDAQGNDWPANKLIGNETVADVKFRLSPDVPGRPRGAYIQAIRVLDLVEYESQDFEPLSEDDEFFAGGPETDDAAPTPEAQAAELTEDGEDDEAPY
jgi:hypothetical protein